MFHCKAEKKAAESAPAPEPQPEKTAAAPAKTKVPPSLLTNEYRTNRSRRQPKAMQTCLAVTTISLTFVLLIVSPLDDQTSTTAKKTTVKKVLKQGSIDC
jgi:hypothetical protein